jgi:hypothetical protein
MPGIFQHLSTLVGSDLEKAADAAQHTFQTGLAEHGHHGRALIETLAKLCRDHPNLVGIGVGILVEQLLSEEKREHDRRQAQAASEPPPISQAPLSPPSMSFAHDSVGVDPFLLAAQPTPAAAAMPAPPPAALPARRTSTRHIRPVRLALEVFGGLTLLKISHAVGRLFGKRRPPHDGWFAAAARIHTLSAALATYCFAASLRSPKVSAWRNAAIGLFGTDAIKPLLKPQKPPRNALRKAA